MSIQIQTIHDCRIVKKPWGQEIWIQAGDSTYPYVLKELHLRAGFVTSLQVHEFKSETIRMHSGQGYLLYHSDPFDCQRFLSGGYSPAELEKIQSELIRYPLTPGLVFHTPPGTVHRMMAETDLHYTEASTTQLDDVVRLEDSYNRGHGRIDSEHA